MDTVQFYACSVAKTLANGREVKIGLSDDGQFWALRFGRLDDPDDSVAFALSAEALEAAEECIRKLRQLARQGGVQKWVLTVGRALLPAENDAHIPSEASAGKDSA